MRARASGALLRRRRRTHDELVDRLRPSGRALLGELHGVGDLGLDLLVDPSELVLFAARGEEALARDAQGIALLLALLDLFARAVLAGIRHRVAAEAVRDDLDERRALAAARAIDRLRDAIPDDDRVLAVEAIARHAVA